MKVRFSFNRTSGWVLGLAALGAAAVLVGISALNVRADDNLQTCDELKQSAKNQLEKDSDLQAALWRRYDHMLNGLMRPMNARLILNGRSIGELAKITDDFAGELSNFSGTFANYKSSADAFLTKKCDETAADTAREITSMRENMSSSKTRLDRSLQSYRDWIVTESEQFQWR
jgi:hypothetical protein